MPRLLKRVLLGLFSLFATLSPSNTTPAHAQVRDSLAVNRFVHKFQYVDNAGYHNCGAFIVAQWEDVLSQVVETTSYSMYSLFAEDQPDPDNPGVRGPEGRYVPSGFGQQGTNETLGLTIPDGFYAHNPQISYGRQGGNFDGCADGQGRIDDFNANGLKGLAGAPFTMTDWWAVYSLEDGTPIAAFTAQQTEQLNVAFDGSFRDGKGSREIDSNEPNSKKPVDAYDWDFGDGNTSTSATPTHGYQSPGTYTVSLTVTDDDGEMNTLTRDIVVRGVVLEYFVTATPTVKTGDELLVQVFVTNKGVVDAEEVRVAQDFSFQSDFPDSAPPPASKDGKRGAPQNGTGLVTFSLAANETETVTQVYLVTAGATETIEGEERDVPVDWESSLPFIAGTDAQGNAAVTNNRTDEVGQNITRVENAPMAVSVLSTTVSGNSVQVNTGLKRWTSGTYPSGVFYHLVPPLSSDPLCNSGCVDLEVTVTDGTGAPLEGAEVELSRVLLEANPGSGADVTPSQGGGIFCKDNQCSKTLKLPPTGADGKQTARFWTPGVVAAMDAYIEAKATKTGYTTADAEDHVVRLNPTLVDFIPQMATPSENDMLALQVASSVQFATGLTNMTKNCNALTNWAAAADAKTAGLKIDGVWKKAVTKGIDYFCGKSLARYWYDEEFALDDEIALRKEKETLVESFGTIVGMLSVYWFQGQFEFSLKGTGTTTLQKSFPFISHSSQFVEVIQGAMYNVVWQRYRNGSGYVPTLEFNLHEVSFNNEGNDYVNALHFGLKTTPDLDPKVDVKQLIDKDYEKRIFLRQERSESTLGASSAPNDETITLAAGSGKTDRAGLTAAGQTSADDSTFAVGHIVVIDPGLASEERVQVTGITESTISLGLPLRFAHAAGARIAYVDSAATNAVPGPPYSTSGVSGLPGAALQPEVSWHTFEPVSSFTVEIATDTLFQDVVQLHEDVLERSITLDVLSDRTRYYWRVAASNANGLGEWSERYSFLTGRPFGDDLAEAHTFTPELDAVRFAWHFAATAETSEALPSCGSGENSLWYSYTPSVSDRVAFETFLSDFDTELSVWQGTAHPLTELACNNNYDNGDHDAIAQSYVEFDAVAGQTYYVRVSGNPATEESEGALLISLRAPTAVGIEEPSDGTSSLPNTLAISAFPNPARDQVSLSVVLPERSETHVELFDMLGRRTMVVAEGTREAGTHAIVIDTATLRSGRYFVRVVAGAHSAVSAVTVMR